MRSWGSFAASAAALALLLSAPAATAKPAGDFARATNAFLDARRDDGPRAQAAAQRHRDAGAQCLDVFRAAPPANRELLEAAYAVDVQIGLLEVDGPIYRRFLDRLERVALRDEPDLMTARRLLRTEVAFFELAPLILDDACTTARAWQASGWRTPPRSIRILHRLGTLGDAADEDLLPAVRVLRRAGHPRAARAVLDAFGPADETIERRDDPVICALLSQDCRA
jgi:hypothetical protein